MNLLTKRCVPLVPCSERRLESTGRTRLITLSRDNHERLGNQVQVPKTRGDDRENESRVAAPGTLGHSFAREIQSVPTQKREKRGAVTTRGQPPFTRRKTTEGGRVIEHVVYQWSVRRSRRNFLSRFAPRRIRASEKCATKRRDAL